MKTARVAVALTAALCLPVAPAHADAATRDLYVHGDCCEGAWLTSRTTVEAEPNSRAADKIEAAHPDDVYELRGSKDGLFIVAAVTSSPVLPSKAAWDLRLHAKGTSVYVFADRIGS